MTVRVRIAPSPTGDPHVGTAYIGLLNFCFARRHGGRFVLRIEDTDQGRCTAASAAAIYRSLKWLGLTYDEGPDVGGGHGPYVQSERVAQGVYRRYADQLLAQGDAYRCFCDAGTLKAMRERQMAEKKTTLGYDRRCRALDPAEAQRRADAGEPHVLRMKAPGEGVFAYRDRLRRKPVEMPWAEVDDQVLLKSDGWPTYHLAAVVDDHLMAISHVIRAEEWLKSMPKHMWLNQHLGFTPPEYVHVGLLRNADKSKISKRKNPTSLLWYERQGYLPEALLNFLAQLGHSHPEAKEVFGLDELCGFFDLDRLNVAGPVFDLKKLDHLQGQWFRALGPERQRAEAHRAIDARFDELHPLLAARMTRGADYLLQAAPFYATAVDARADDLLPKGWERPEAKAVLEAVAKALKEHLAADRKWDAAALDALLKALVAERGAAADPLAPRWSDKGLWMLLRVAVTGRKESPPTHETLAAIGPVRVIERLAAAAAKL